MLLLSLPLLALRLAALPAQAVIPAGASDPAPRAAVYSGRDNALHVRVPRLEAEVRIDGALDEPAWERAAVLTGFSQYSPQDRLPAVDSTEVLVWYSPTAIHFGIRAYEAHGAPHATLADRDHIDADDNVQLLIGTFDDGRQATVFGVNPLGVQMDGTIVETGSAGGGGFMSSVQARQAADLSQDFVFQSKGRLTPWGYEIEVRIPFKSLKYQAVEEQRWGFNVVRRVQHSGHEDSWVPAKRASASFLGQSGTLDGLRELHRGLVLDVNPVVTQRTIGGQVDPARPGLGWRYTRGDPELGGNVRWGMTNNLTLNATANPDFSQVESDAGQFAFDPRSALYFPEKRPFFLEGMEGFTTPSNLVYTRTIVQPVFAAKITGKTAGTQIAFLSAVDDRSVSDGFDPLSGARGHEPIFNILRLQRDVGPQSRVGVTYTDRMIGRYANRVADVDGRLVFGGLYSLNFQGAVSRTTDSTTRASGPLVAMSLNRLGKRYNARFAFSEMSEEFIPGAGFISRPGITHAVVDQNFIAYGSRASLVESFTFNPYYDLIWKTRYFQERRDAIEKKLHFNLSTTLRGGWNASAALLLETFGYDPDLYAGLYVAQPSGAPTPFVGTPRLPNRDWVLSLGTPQWGMLSLSAMYLWGQDENFDEWASSGITYTSLSALVRPTERLRITPSFQMQTYDRQTSGALVRVERDTRIKTEYQIARPLFFRLVGEYRTHERLPLRDESRTNAPLVVSDGSGGFVPIDFERGHGFRADWLIAYQPNPGTVFFAGYGASTAPLAPSLSQLTQSRFRTQDAFFVKASYLFRM